MLGISWEILLYKCHKGMFIATGLSTACYCRVWRLCGAVSRPKRIRQDIQFDKNIGINGYAARERTRPFTPPSRQETHCAGAGIYSFQVFDRDVQSQTDYRCFRKIFFYQIVLRRF